MDTKEKKNLILVPTDFTEAADCAVNHAINLAKSSGASVTLVHVVNKETKSKLKKEGQTVEAIEEKLKKQCYDIGLNEGVTADYIYKEGSIFTTIGEVAKETEAKLLVMGTHGVVGVQHLVGAFAVRVITTSPVPVIIVQKKKINPNGYKKIIYPVNASKENKHKVLHTISIARQYDAEVHLFVAYDSDEFISNAIRNNVAHTEKYFTKNEVKYVKQQMDHKGPGFAKQVIKYASQNDADLIIILTDEGSEGSVTEFILGADHEKIINNDGQIAVMCINPMEELYKIGNILFQ